MRRLACLAAGLLLAAPAAPARGRTTDLDLLPRVEAELIVPDAAFEEGGGVPLDLRLRNPSRLPVEVPAACLGAGALRVRRLRDLAMLEPSRAPRVKEAATVPPFQELKLSFDLHRLFKGAREPGTYEVRWRCGDWTSRFKPYAVAARYDAERDRVALLKTELGTLEIVLMPEQAPIHVRNFVMLARSGFYDGMAFYRVIPGILAETGDPSGDGSGAWDRQLPAEVDERIFPGKGLVGALRQDDPRSTSASAFFILLNASPGYQGLHTFFAFVRKGMDVLDAIASLKVDTEGPGRSFQPLSPLTVQKIEIRPH